MKVIAFETKNNCRYHRYHQSTLTGIALHNQILHPWDKFD